MKRADDSAETIYPPSYRQNSCFFDCAYMAIFGIDDSWINDNFLYKNINKDFINSYEPSLHLKANDGNNIYNLLYKKKSLNKSDIIDILEYAKTLPLWENDNSESSFIFSKKITKKHPNNKDIQKMLSIVRNQDIKNEINCKKNLQYNLKESVKSVRNGEKAKSILESFKYLIISNKCIPDDEEFRQTLFTSQEQSAISIIRFLFDLFYIKPATLINTKIYSNEIDNVNQLIKNSNNKIISYDKTHPIYLLQSCDFIKKEEYYSIQELINNGTKEIHTSDSGFEYKNNKYKNIIKTQQIINTDFLVIELERFIFPTNSMKQFSHHIININENITINNKILYLKSIICHFGNTNPIPISFNNTGHYVSYNRTIKENKESWYFYDDMPCNREGKPTFEKMGTFNEMLEKHKHINKNCVVLIYTCDEGTKRNKNEDDYNWLF